MSDTTPDEGRSATVYLFRHPHTGAQPGTVLCLAPLDLVALTYGGGGDDDLDGLRRAFGGHLLYRDPETGEHLAGVWGRRTASRFRTALRRRATIQVVPAAPAAILIHSSTALERPPVASQRGLDEPHSQRAATCASLPPSTGSRP